MNPSTKGAPDAPEPPDAPAGTGIGQRKRAWRWVLAALISVAFLVWVAGQADWPALQAASARLSLVQWALASLVLWITYVIRAARLHQEFKGRTALGLLDWLRISLMHNTLVNWLPLRSGEVAFPLLLKREAGLPLSDSLSALLWLRLQDALVLVGVGLVCWPGWPWGLRVGLVVLALVLILTLPLLMNRLKAWSGSWPKRGLAWRNAFFSPHRHAKPIWALTILNWTVKLAVQATLLAWLLPAPWTTAWLGAVGAEWAVFLPLQGWAGVGTYEAGAALAMGLEGLDWAVGLQFALVMHIWVLANATLAGLLAGLVTVQHSQRA